MMDEEFETLKKRYWLLTCLADIDGALKSKTDEILNKLAAEQYDLHKDDIVTVAALVTVLSHKCWFWHDQHDDNMSQIYSDLYYEYNNKAWDWLEKHGSDEERTWYFHTMD